MAKEDRPIDLRKVVVDTGPLINVLCLTFVMSSPTHEYRLEQSNVLPLYLRHNPTKERYLLELFDSIQTILITSHVIGELTGRLKVSKLPLREFWLSSEDYLTGKNVDERLLSLIEICGSDRGRESLRAIGPTDSGLIELALQEKCVLLTDDERTLARRAWDLGLGDQCKLVRNLL